jgi:hypothetical protein
VYPGNIKARLFSIPLFSCFSNIEHLKNNYGDEDEDGFGMVYMT